MHTHQGKLSPVSRAGAHTPNLCTASRVSAYAAPHHYNPTANPTANQSHLKPPQEGPAPLRGALKRPLQH